MMTSFLHDVLDISVLWTSGVECTVIDVYTVYLQI